MSDNLRVASVAPKRLSQSISSSATTIALVDINGRDGTALTISAFGDIGFATLEPGATNMELISFTGISSTSLTGVTRGLNFIYPYTTSSSLQKAHPAGSKLVFSNSPTLYNEFAAKDNEETISQVWTFNELPQLDSYEAPTTNAQFAAKKYVDDVAAGGTASINRVVVAGTGGATIVAGNLLYLNSSDGEWYLCDADTASTVDNVLLGIAQGAGSDGATISGGVILSGIDANQSGLTAGAIQYASNTAGAIASSAGTTEVTVGIARTATELYFMPRFNQQITEAQQDLLDGITASATELNNLDGYTGTTADLNEASAIVQATNITGAELETLSDGSDADSLHTHSPKVSFFSVHRPINASTPVTVSGGTSLSDGFYATRGTTALAIDRLVQDANSNIFYYQGTSVSLTQGTETIDVAVGTTYVWASNENAGGTDTQITRYNKDLSGLQAMTISGTASTDNYGKMTGNDSILYLWVASSANIYPYSISGTTATRGTTITLSDGQVEASSTQLWFDGTNLYTMDDNAGSGYRIREYNTSGTLQSTTNIVLDNQGNNGLGILPAWDSSTIYLVKSNGEYFEFTAVTKP